MAVKRMLVEIGYAHFIVDARDAILLLDISARSIRVERPDYKKPYQQAADQSPPIAGVELVDYEPLALPDLSLQAPAPTLHPSDEEIPF